MTDDFEDHCWKDIVTPDVLEVYSCYRRKVFVGPSPALLAVDLYDVVYRGGPRPPAELAKTHPNTCGEYAYAAIEPTKRLFAAARAAGLPIFYSTGDVRAESRPSLVTATKRNKPPVDPADYAIRPEFKPQPQDVVITKQRASVFFGTPLVAHLTQVGVQTLIVCGESTSGCVRATAVDAYSHGYHVVAGGGVLLRSQHPVPQSQSVRPAPQIRGRDACRSGDRASRRHGRQEGELMRA